MTPPPTAREDALLDEVQRQTLRYFWEFAHPVSGLARDRSNPRNDPENDTITIGGTGFGIMALLVGAERGWLERGAVLERLRQMLGFLWQASNYHGVLPHFLNGRTGRTIVFSRKDDGADLVETSFLIMGLLCARQYFSGGGPEESAFRASIDRFWAEVEWDWHTRGGGNVLLWHWSPNHGWSMNFELRGWNECLITYLLAVAAPRYAIDPALYHAGWAQGLSFRNGRRYYDIELPLGPDFGGPLFFTHYSFMGLDPRGLADRYADYWRQNTAHARIHHAHAVHNPNGHAGYGDACWGFTASDTEGGYAAHDPQDDRGVVTPTAALASMPYTPAESMRALAFFRSFEGGRLWGEYGFHDAFKPDGSWVASSFLAIDQAPIVVMIENHRTGLLWRLFMGCPEIKAALAKLGFQSPHLEAA